MDTESQKPDNPEIPDLKYKPAFRRDMIAEWIFEMGGLKDFRIIRPAEIAEHFKVSYSTAQSDLKHPQIADKVAELIRSHAGGPGMARAWEVVLGCLNCGLPGVQLSAAKYILDNGGVFIDNEGDVDMETIMEAIHGNGHAEDGAYCGN